MHAKARYCYYTITLDFPNGIDWYIIVCAGADKWTAATVPEHRSAGGFGTQDWAEWAQTVL